LVSGWSSDVCSSDLVHASPKARHREFRPGVSGCHLLLPSAIASGATSIMTRSDVADAPPPPLQRQPPPPPPLLAPNPQVPAPAVHAVPADGPARSPGRCSAPSQQLFRCGPLRLGSLPGAAQGPANATFLRPRRRELARTRFRAGNPASMDQPRSGSSALACDCEQLLSNSMQPKTTEMSALGLGRPGV